MLRQQPKLMFFSPATLNYNKLYQKIITETAEHIQYLTEIGLRERANKIKVTRFKSEQYTSSSINLSSFTKRTHIPKMVMNFNQQLKNTIITTDPESKNNKPEDLKKILDIRLYPALRNLIKRHSAEIFLGSNSEMVEYYQANGSAIVFQFSIPSSATYYLIDKGNNDFRVVMADLVSHENIIAQLLTLKLAEIPIDQIELIGEIEHFSLLVKNDFVKLIHEIPQMTAGNNILVVAGCGLERQVSDIINHEYNDKLGPSKVFKGDILSLTYTPFINTENNIQGFISLNLNYGEITELVITSLLEQCHCTHVFTGGAGGYISNMPDDKKPDIGSRVSITQCMNEQGEVVKLNGHIMSPGNIESPMHLQIPSIFLETYSLLEKAKQRGGSVDVETFYIVKAIQEFNNKNPSNPIKADCGYFVSDYVGEKPLRDYSHVYDKYHEILSNFLRDIVYEKSVSYKPK
jgi:hypothetical protein